MAVLGKNECTPQRIFGPLPQTLFCGLTVKNFSITAGWNEQSSSLTVELVEDTCAAGTKYYWDENLNRQTLVDQADPGFILPEPGCAGYFRMEEDPTAATSDLRGGIEYCGIFQSWNRKYDSQGNPVYVVKLTDPRTLLSNAKVITNDYVENTQGVWNLINVYGYVEGLALNCPVSPAGGIGGTTDDNAPGFFANERGMVWNDVKCALHTLISSTNQTLADNLYGRYCRDARLVGVGPQTGKTGYGIIKQDGSITDANYVGLPGDPNINVHAYLLDLTEIPFAPLHYRVQGPTASLADLISEVCTAAGCDYYLELLPAKVAGKVEKIIKVRVADRTQQPETIFVDAYVAARKADNSIISYTEGEELRSEHTSTFIAGGKIRDPFSVGAGDILPFWGFNADGTLQAATISGDWYIVTMDFLKVSGSLTNPISQFVAVHELEMRAALGSFDTFREVCTVRGGPLGTWLDGIEQYSEVDWSTISDVITNNNKLGPEAAIGWDTKGRSIEDAAAKDAKIVYEFVRTFASNFYGRQFLVNASNVVCFARDTSTPNFSNNYKFNYEPSTEGCWVRDAQNGLPIGSTSLLHNTSESDIFRDAQGKYSAYLQFGSTAYKLSKAGSLVIGSTKTMNSENISSLGGKVWVKADVNANWIRGTNLVPSASTTSFLVTIDAPYMAHKTEDLGLTDEQAGFDIINEVAALSLTSADLTNQNNFYTSDLDLAAPTPALMPEAGMCPILNNTETYGPWGVAGLPGSVLPKSFDDSYVPWEFGSDTFMNLAAAEEAGTSATNMRKGERGAISVAGFPNLPLGAELFSADAASVPKAMGAQKYLDTRVLDVAECHPFNTISYYYCDMNAWTGEFGPNVTSINVTVGANGFTTSYEFSTYVPRFGNLQKENAERLKRVGQQNLANQRQLRAFQKLLKNSNIGIATFAGNSANGGGGAGGGSNTTLGVKETQNNRADKRQMGLLAGKYNANENKALVQGGSYDDMKTSIPNDTTWDSTAISSPDAFYLPSSKQGAGGLPQMVSSPSETNCDSKYSRSSNPPFAEYDPINVNVNYLDPYSIGTSTIVTDRDDGGGSGHTIMVASRAGGAPNTAIDTESQAESDDVKFLSMRGPILLKSWGYDINNKPIPNAGDTLSSAKAGTFSDSNLSDKFLDNFLAEPAAWPMAPIDFRFDRERRVWTMPQPPRMVIGDVPGCDENNINDITIENDNKGGVQDSAGSNVAAPTIGTGYWPWDIQMPSGIGKLPIYYDEIDCKHYIIPTNRLDHAEGTPDDPTNLTSLTQDLKTLIFDTTGRNNGQGQPNTGVCEGGANDGGNPLRFVLTPYTDACNNEQLFVQITGEFTGGGPGININIGASEGICFTEPGSEVAYGPIDTINFSGPAIRGTQSVECELDIESNGGFYISQIPGCSEDSETLSTFPEVFINQLVVGSGLSTSISGYNPASGLNQPGDPCIQMISLDFQIDNDNTCGTDQIDPVGFDGIPASYNGATSPKPAYGLTFGSGFIYTPDTGNDPCSNRVDLLLLGSGTNWSTEWLDKCNNNNLGNQGGQPAAKIFTRINFIGDLSVRDSDSACTIEVSGFSRNIEILPTGNNDPVCILNTGPPWSSGDSNATYQGSYCSPNANGDPVRIDRLIGGRGIGITAGCDLCEVIIYQDVCYNGSPTVGDCDTTESWGWVDNINFKRTDFYLSGGDSVSCVPGKRKNCDPDHWREVQVALQIHTADEETHWYIGEITCTQDTFCKNADCSSTAPAIVSLVCECYEFKISPNCNTNPSHWFWTQKPIKCYSCARCTGAGCDCETTTTQAPPATSTGPP